MTLFTLIMLASVVGCGVYLLLSSHYGESLVGVALLSNGVNLLLIESSHSVGETPDPLPQALILTAIVIGFALLSFLAAFILHRYREHGNDRIPCCEEEVGS